MPMPKKVKYTKLERDLLEAASAMLAYENAEQNKSSPVIYKTPEKVDVTCSNSPASS